LLCAVRLRGKKLGGRYCNRRILLNNAKNLEKEPIATGRTSRGNVIFFIPTWLGSLVKIKHRGAQGGTGPLIYR